MGNIGYFKKLEMTGFKSFADKTELEFRDGITVVVGPNGSGKSNIVDAIRWVLGEQSIKSLRGKKSEDVIFAGTEFRRGLGFADVSIILDNSEQIFKIDYEEIKITRRIYRDGTSEYLINGSKCKLKTITELFMDTGIGKDGYSIIGQGKIDEILSSNHTDRRKVFEEATGIGKYKTRKEESEKKLEKTNQNLLRVEDILSEIEPNIKNLENKSKKAKQYLNLREKLKKIEISIFAKTLENLKQKQGETVSYEKSLDESIQSINLNLKIKKNKLEQKKENISETYAGIQDIKDKELADEKEYSVLKNNIILYENKIEINEEQIKKNKLKIEENKLKIDNLKLEISEKKLKNKKYKEDSQEFVQERDEKQEELNKLLKKLSESQLKTEEKKELLDNNKDKKYNLENEKSIFETQLEVLNNEKNKNFQKKQTINYEIDKMRININEYLFNNRETENNKKLQTQKTEEIDKKIEKVNTRYKSILDIEIAKQGEMNLSKGRLNLLETLEKDKDGFNFGIKKILKEKENRTEYGRLVDGVIADLIKVPKKFTSAIEMALGYSLQNIVVENKENAKNLIEFLKNNKYGRASFLPIDSMESKKFYDEDKIKNITGYLGIASDLIKYNNKHKNIIENLLGRTLIVKDMNSAIKISNKVKNIKIVTLDGDIINTSGSMTGGSVYKSKSGLLGRKDEITELKTKIVNLENEIKNINKEKKEIISELELLNNTKKEYLQNTNDINIEYARFQEKYNAKKNELKKREQEKLEINSRNQEIEKEIQELNLKISDKKNEIEKIKIENNDLNKQISEQKDFKEQDRIDDLTDDLTNLKISLSSFEESISSGVEFIKILEAQRTENEKEIQDFLETNNNLKVEIDEKKSEIEEINKKIEKIIVLKSDSIELLNTLESNLTELKQEENHLEQNILAETTQLDNLREKKNKVELNLQRLELEREQLLEKMWNNYEITQANIPELILDKEIDEKEGKKKADILREKIKALGSIDVDSIYEYVELKERYDFLSEQKQDLYSSIEDLEKVIKNMLSVMKDTFNDKFTEINKNFQEVFKQLFGGGKSQIKLKDEKDPLNTEIEINVQPPGKKLQTMTLLSGGERALTAIALLFAILKTNPSPFCVLDEIDAALDDINVYRFAEYLKKYAQEIQFLVITHRKGTMEIANTVYGTTMEEKGISKLVSLDLKDSK